MSSRRQTGDFPTPLHVADRLVQESLIGLLDEVDDPSAIRVLDPACGGGALLLSAGRAIAQFLRGRGVAPDDATDIAGRCLCGVEIHPRRAADCRLSLRAAGFGGATIVRGDALLGAGRDCGGGGIPPAAYRALPGDDAAVSRTLARDARAAPRLAAATPHRRRLMADMWSAAFLLPTRDAAAIPHPADLAAAAAGVPTRPDLARAIRAVRASHGPVHMHLLIERLGAKAGVDLVLANPPFLSPGAVRGARGAREIALIRARLGPAARALTDASALFLADAMDLVRPGGRVAMILPESFLGARDATGVRARAMATARPEWLWTGGTGLFPANITVCGVVLRDAAARTGSVRRATGGSMTPSPTQPMNADEWLDGAPWRLSSRGTVRTARTRGVVSDMARPVAGHRRHFYGVLPFVVDDQDGDLPRLITAGLIDPARSLWGRVPARIGGRLWSAPRVDVAGLRESGQLPGWVEAMSVPKVMVATQTRVIECAVDTTGACLPATPVIALCAHGDDAWLLAAALSSPHASRVAEMRHAGTALSPDAIKMSASQVGALPLPGRPGPWHDAARALITASCATDRVEWLAALDCHAALMAEAYALRADDDATSWWRARLPPFRG